MKNIVVAGSSGHAKVVIDILNLVGEYRLQGILDPNNHSSPLGKVLGAEQDLPVLIEQHKLDAVFVAIGDNAKRAAVAASIREIAPRLEFVSLVHPNACVARDVHIGTGSVLMAGVCVNPGASIGEFCILNTASCLEHDSRLQDFASLGPGACVAGDCDIGPHAAINLGAVISNGLSIGEHSVIGAGSVVLQSVIPYTLAYGVPAKPIRQRKAGEAYF